jgi:plastocyanin
MKNIVRLRRNSALLLFPGVLLFAWGCSHSKPQLYTVEIKDMKFKPAELDIHKGDTVQWINRDIVAHDVTEQTKKEWSSSPMSTGGSWKRVFAGSADYFCNIHKVMKGKIKVD